MVSLVPSPWVKELEGFKGSKVFGVVVSWFPPLEGVGNEFRFRV